MVESSFPVEDLQNLDRLSLSAQVCVVHCQNKQVIFVISRNHFSLNVPYWWRVDHIIYHFTELKIYHHSLFISKNSSKFVSALIQSFNILVSFRVPGNIGEELVLRTRLLDCFIILNLSRHIFFKSYISKIFWTSYGFKSRRKLRKKKVQVLWGHFSRKTLSDTKQFKRCAAKWVQTDVIFSNQIKPLLFHSLKIHTTGRSSCELNLPKWIFVASLTHLCDHSREGFFIEIFHSNIRLFEGFIVL